jgi:hypothetical protein
MCVNVDGRHHHVLICVSCHLREIELFALAAAQAFHEQQEIIDKMRKPKLGVVQ